ncbi:MAG: tripartite tricarboxylate transporter substrate binding protein, partial [Janthinobacterium sp.]
MLRSLFLSLLCLLPALAAAQAPAPAECVVPSKPGGAMDLTCKLAKKGLAQESAAGVASPMRITY